MNQKKRQADPARQPRTIDGYFAAFPPEIRQQLEKIRETIREAAPGSVETIGYGIPTIDLNGRHLVHFAAFKKHIGFFPTSSGIEAFREELSEFETSTGTVRFPLGKPLPLDLVKRIVIFRVREVERGEQ